MTFLKNQTKLKDETHLLAPMPFLHSQGLPRYSLAKPRQDFWDTLYIVTNVLLKINNFFFLNN
jgi:hypothetical protein